MRWNWITQVAAKETEDSLASVRVSAEALPEQEEHHAVYGIAPWVGNLALYARTAERKATPSALGRSRKRFDIAPDRGDLVGEM